MRIGFLAGGAARGGSCSPLPATAGEGSAGLALAVRAARGWEGGFRKGATRYSRGRASGAAAALLSLCSSSAASPRRRAALVPVVQQRAGFVDRQPEPFDEHAGRVKRLVMAALAGDGAGNSGEIGGRPTLPVVARLSALPLSLSLPRSGGGDGPRRGGRRRRRLVVGLSSASPCRLSHASRSTGGKTVSSPGVAPREGSAPGQSDSMIVRRAILLHGVFLGSAHEGRRGAVAPGPTPSSVTSRQGRSGRGEPLAFRVPGRPINRAGLTVAVSITTAWSL